MYDEADVRFVDAHTEGDGCDDDADFLHQELVLVLRPGLGVQARVVGKCADAVDAQHLCQLFHLFTAEAVDDARFPWVLADELDDVLFRLHLIPDFVIQVGSIKGRFEHFGVLDAQVLEDVALHLGRGSGREGDDRSVLDFFDYRPDFPVLRTEVVAPFRYAVGFIHRIEGDVDFLEEGDVFLLGEGFRGDVQQFGDAGEEVLPHFRDLGPGEGRVQEVGDAVVAGHEAADGIDLILHKGDEGGDDDGRPLHYHSRKLVAEGFAGSRRHQYEGVVAFYEVLDDAQLVPLESVVTEELFQAGA